MFDMKISSLAEFILRLKEVSEDAGFESLSSNDVAVLPTSHYTVEDSEDDGYCD
jgi:hypothetical protein